MWTRPAALAGKGPGDRTTLSRTVADHIGSMIRQGGLKPGDQLPSQRDLAVRFGVSRPSLREAISVLETMGLVTVRVGSGIYVAPAEARAPLWRFSDRASPRDVYEARVGLEGYAARLAAVRVDAAAAVWLEEAVAAMAEALAAEDIPGMASADARFHDLIFEIGGNPVLAGMYRPMRDMMVESQRLPMTLKTRLGDTLEEHRTLSPGSQRGTPRGHKPRCRTISGRRRGATASRSSDTGGGSAQHEGRSRHPSPPSVRGEMMFAATMTFGLQRVNVVVS